MCMYVCMYVCKYCRPLQTRTLGLKPAWDLCSGVRTAVAAHDGRNIAVYSRARVGRAQGRLLIWVSAVLPLRYTVKTAQTCMFCPEAQRSSRRTASCSCQGSPKGRSCRSSSEQSRRRPAPPCARRGDARAPRGCLKTASWNGARQSLTQSNASKEA